jgi:SAM-dependent methyltransferase
MLDLASQFGNIDVYLFDQILRGRVPPGARVLDAGCGGGRNLVYLLRAGCEVFAADDEPAAVEQVRRLARELAPRLPADHFRVEPLEQLSFAEASVEVVICSAVLHFARDPEHFRGMLDGAWRVLAPGGLFFARLASSIGMEDRMRPIGDGRYALPDGSERFLVDHAMLLAHTARLGATLADPIKTTVVQDQRCMTTWVFWKGQGRVG